MTTVTTFRLLLSFCCGGLAIASAERVVFHADWFPGAQFAGLYAADAQGEFDRAGIELDWRDFAFGQKPIDEMIATPEVCALGTIEGYIFVQRRAAGNDVQALAAMLQESPAGYMSLAAAGITTIADFKGRIIGVHKFADPLFRWFLQRGDLDPATVDMRFTGDDVGQLTRGELDAMQGYATEEYVRLQAEAGTSTATRFLSFAELGFPAYSEVIYTTKAQAEAHAATIKNFLAATRRGWVWVFAHPAEAAQLVAARVGPEADLTHIRAALNALRPYVMPEGQAPLAPMSPEKWQAMQRACHEMGLVPTTEPVATFLPSPAP